MGKGQALVVQPAHASWAKDVRMPLEARGRGRRRYTVFYTGFEQPPRLDAPACGQGRWHTCAIGFAELKAQ